MTIILQQTKAEHKLADAIKNYAKDNNQKLQCVYSEAIREFMDYLKSIDTNKNSAKFYTSPKEGKTINLKIPESVKSEGLALARMHQVSARRLYYTALVRFAESKFIININEDLINDS